MKNRTPGRNHERTDAQVPPYANDIVNTVREPLLLLNEHLKVISANRSFYRTFGVDADETLGRFICDLGDRQWDIPKLREAMEEIIPHPLRRQLRGCRAEIDR